MNVQLINDDCLNVLRTLPDGSIDAVICDLPYGTTNCSWDVVIPFEPLWTQYKRLVKKGGAIVLFASQPFTSFLVCSNPKWFKHDVVWEKDRSTGHLNARIEPMRKHEDILVFADGRVTYNPQMSKKPAWKVRPVRAPGGTPSVYGKLDPNAKPIASLEMSYPTSVYPSATTNTGERGFHPTQKPVALLEYLIRTYSNEGEIVLDNTMGSGSTGVACVNTGRKFIGMELRADYFEIAKARIEAAQSQGIFDLEATR